MISNSSRVTDDTFVTLFEIATNTGLTNFI